MQRTSREAYEALDGSIAERGLDLEWIEERLRAQRVETPSWGYGNSGTRFAVFPQEGVPRNPFEKIEDAAEVNRHTGISPSVAIHIPWDAVEDYGTLREHAESLGMQIGAVNPNLFQDKEYRLGSVCNPEERIRRKATDHLLECVRIAEEVGSREISLWLADGTNYPGQDSFSERRSRMIRCLSELYGAMPEGMRLLVEYKPFEPAFYHTDIPDWGAALTICRHLGERAQVLVDLGHHLQGTNIEQIVSLLLDEDRLGGFHFNARKYADDDLIVGSINPFELFLIYVELLEAEEKVSRPISYMIDQSHNVEPKIEAMILSITNLQEAYAKALLVDRRALHEARLSGDVLGAHRILQEAYATDVRPLCAKVREDLGASPDPVDAFRKSRYAQRVREERRGGTPAGWS